MAIEEGHRTFSLRLENELYHLLKKDAIRNNRSLSGSVRHLIKVVLMKGKKDEHV